MLCFNSRSATVAVMIPLNPPVVPSCWLKLISEGSANGKRAVIVAIQQLCVTVCNRLVAIPVTSDRIPEIAVGPSTLRSNIVEDDIHLQGFIVIVSK